MKNILISLSLISLLLMACSPDKASLRQKYLGNINTDNRFDNAVAEMPNMTVGDTFVMAGKMINGKDGFYTAEVVKINEDKSFVFEITDKKGEHYLAFFDGKYQLNKFLNMNNSVEEIIPLPPENILDFPLYVGKKWKVRVGAVHKSKGIGFYRMNRVSPTVYAFPVIGHYPTMWSVTHGYVEMNSYDFEYTVDRFETVTTKAGSFKAFKIIRAESYAASGVLFDGKEEYWYSPELKSIIKSNPSWRKGWELTEYKIASLRKTDIDEIPVFKSASRESDLAVVIGIEKYQNIPKSEFSKSDADIVSDYLKALGFKEENMQFITDDKATCSSIEKIIEAWLPNRVKKDSMVFVYYSGHGAPNTATGESFLVPYDGDPNYIEKTGYPLKRLYAELGKLDSTNVVVVLDSCFSGAGGRSVLARGARPLVMMIQDYDIPDNVVVLAASKGNQISSASPDKGHGILTYYFLKALKEGKNTLEEIYTYLRPLVQEEAKQLNVVQSPCVEPDNRVNRNIFLITQ